MSAPRRTATLTFAIAVEVAPEHPHFHPWPSPGQMAEPLRRAIEAQGLQVLELANRASGPRNGRRSVMKLRCPDRKTPFALKALDAEVEWIEDHVALGGAVSMKPKRSGIEGPLTLRPDHQRGARP